jgi:glycosyltransferase involved in cell wall biosynthesis
MNKITYFDFSDLRYTSFFINGFIANEKERGFRLDISRKVPPEFEDLDPLPAWLTEMVPLSLYRVEGNDPFLFCIEGDDKNGLDEPLGEFYWPFLERCRYYFKVNYNADVINASNELKPFASKIKPTPIVYPLAPSAPWRLRPKLTPIGGPSWPSSAIRRRLSFLRRSATLEKYHQWRYCEKDIDLFFVTIIYAQPKFKELVAKRRLLVDGLNKYGQFNIVARYVCPGKTGEEECGPYEIERMDYRDYLQYSARSRLGIYIRGNHEGLSFKFGELMAMGKPIVGETLVNNRDNMYAYDRFDEQFAYDDPAELIDRVVYLLQNPQELEDLRRANIETFDYHFTPKPVVKHILDQLDVF